MKRTIILLIILFLIIAGSIFISYHIALTKLPPPIENARCSDFETQGEAQEFYERYKAYQLDRDNDKVACENLPLTGGYALRHK